MSFNPLTAQLHPPPAGHVSAANAELAERESIRLELMAEREAAARAALEREIDAHIAERRGTAANAAPENAVA